MSAETLRETVLRVLGQVAPEVDTADVDDAEDLREQLDLDSMDILNLAIGLYEATGVEIPEADYGAVVTVQGAVDYLASRVGAD